MFSELVVTYLFLGGTGAGALLISAVLMFFADDEDVRCGLASRFTDSRSAAYRRLFTPALVVALGTLALGALALVADVGRLDRLLLLAVSPLSNYLVVGFWALLLCGVLAVVMLLAWLGVMPLRLLALKVLAVLLAVVSFVAVVYTGLLLSGMPSVPLWFSPWLPVLFVLSALSCGTALLTGVTMLSGMLAVFGRTMRRVLRLDMALLVFEAITIALWLGTVWVQNGGAAPSGAVTPTAGAALESVAALLSGARSLVFWGGLVLVGLVAPFAMETALARRTAGKGVVEASSSSCACILASAGCVLVGGACLRAAVVAAGMLPVLASPL